MLRRRDVLSVNLVKLFIIRQKYWIVEPEIILKFHGLYNLRNIFIKVVTHRPNAHRAIGRERYLPSFENFI